MKYLEVTFTLSPCNDDICDVLSALLAQEAGFDTFTPVQGGLLGYVRPEQFNPSALEALVAEFPWPGIDIAYTVAEADDRNWNEEWENTGFRPLRIGDALYVYDPRHDEPSDEVELNIRICPRQAFGTGSHQTTALILGYLLSAPLQGTRVVDAGCGTGILGILAAKRGAAEVLAYDIDEWSVRNTQDNLQLNEVLQVEVKEGDAGVLSEAAPADWVIANINRNILLHDMPAFVAALKPEGHLLLSGFYTADIPLLEAEAARHGLHTVHTESRDDWALLVLTR